MMSQSIFKPKRLWFLGICLLLWGSYWVYQNKTLGFTPARIISDFPYNPQWDVEEVPEVKKILDQKFTFLAVGSQSYAFVSEDGKYVIKFFRMKHRIPRISDLFHPGQVKKRRETLLSVFDAHKLAYDEMREDAGLIYIHLNKSDHLKTKLHVKDAMRRIHLIDLDQTEFVIQEKAELIFTRLKKLGHKEASINAILQLVQRRIDRGVTDHDKAVKHNYGFIGDRPVQIDIGRIYKERKPRDILHVKARINKWMASQSSFSPQQIASTLPVHPEWVTPSANDEQRKILALSPFKFLGEGAQAYAFESSDGKYVIKFFKMRRFTPDLIDCLCPHLAYRRIKNLRWVFNGYKMAYDQFREDTALIYIHLAKTNDLHQSIEVMDEAGQSHFIDLDQTEFVVQEKAELIFDHLRRLNLAERQKAISSVLSLVQRRIDKGYADRDNAVSNNYGFVGDRPIQLDIGRLYEGTRENQLEHVKNRIQLWERENAE